MEVDFSKGQQIIRKFFNVRLLLSLLRLIFHKEGGHSGQEEDENEESERNSEIAF